MPISPSDTYDLVAEACSFPASRDAVVDQAGSTMIAAQGGDAVALETVLDRSDQSRFRTARELHTTVVANLTDEHVGRKAYDDRSPNPARSADVSF